MAFKKVTLKLFSHLLRYYTLLVWRLKYNPDNKLRISRNGVIYATYNIFGKGNIICVDSNAKIKNCRFIIKGNNNIIHIGKKCNIAHSTFWVEDSDNKIEIGDMGGLGKSYIKRLCNI